LRPYFAHLAKVVSGLLLLALVLVDQRLALSLQFTFQLYLRLVTQPLGE